MISHIGSLAVMEVNLHYFVNVLMAKSENGLPAYRKMAYYKDEYMTMINEDNVHESETKCPKCNHTVFILTIDGKRVYQACSSVDCDFAEMTEVKK
jgi:hypothetical protein